MRRTTSDSGPVNPRLAVQETAAAEQQAADREYQRERAALREGTAAPPAPAPSRAAVAPENDVEKAAQAEYEAEVRALRAEKAAETVRHADHAAGRRRLPPISARPQFKRIDQTVQVDKDGQPAGTPGYSKKWVPVTDLDGKPHDFNIAQHEAEGFRLVKSRDPEGPNEFRSPFGVLMEIAPRDKAAREVAFAPAGAVGAHDFFAAQAELEADQINRAHGGRRLGMERDDEHQEYRSYQLHPEE